MFWHNLTIGLTYIIWVHFNNVDCYSKQHWLGFFSRSNKMYLVGSTHKALRLWHQNLIYSLQLNLADPSNDKLTTSPQHVVSTVLYHKCAWKRYEIPQAIQHVSLMWSDTSICYIIYCYYRKTEQNWPYTTFTLVRLLVPLEARFALTYSNNICLVANCILSTWICFLSTYISAGYYK